MLLSPVKKKLFIGEREYASILSITSVSSISLLVLVKIRTRINIHELITNDPPPISPNTSTIKSCQLSKRLDIKALVKNNWISNLVSINLFSQPTNERLINSHVYRHLRIAKVCFIPCRQDRRIVRRDEYTRR